jgi:aspartyl-tRNA(Asn)/glutamyl-tRNA(Gln) amidotransferase subunit C
MSITRRDVETVARLAHLDLAPADAERVARELSAVLDYMAVLARVDPGTWEEPPEDAAPLREDAVRPGLAAALAVAGAPGADGGLFKVPPMLSGGER